MSILENYEILKNAKPINHLLSDALSSFGINITNEDNSDVNSISKYIFYEDFNCYYGQNVINLTIDIIINSDIDLSIVNNSLISFGIGKEGYLKFKVRIAWSQAKFLIVLENIELNIRFNRSILKPIEVNINDKPILGNNQFIELPGEKRACIYSTLDISYDSENNLDFQGINDFNLTACKISGYPIALILNSLNFNLSSKSTLKEILDAGYDETFRGVYVENLSIFFAGELDFLPDIEAEKFIIGSEGISGSISATWDSESPITFFGFSLIPKNLDLTIQKNTISEFHSLISIEIPALKDPDDNPFQFDADITFQNDIYSLAHLFE